MSSPSAEDRLCTLENVAETSLLCKPLFCYGGLVASMYCYPLLWIGVPGTVMDNIYNSMRPCPDRITKMNHYEFTDLDEDASFSHYRTIRDAEDLHCCFTSTVNIKGHVGTVS